MKKILLALFWLCVSSFIYSALSCAAEAQILFTYSDPSPPAPAVTAGFNTLTFSPSFSALTFDSSRTYLSGFSFYYANWFGETNFASLSINGNGTAVLTSTNNTEQDISTVGIVSGNTWVGTAFGGGFYAEARIQFNASAVVTANGWPAWWAEPLEHIANLPAQQWTGQAAGYSHFVETDFMEYFPETFTNAYHMGIRDFYGIFNATCPPSYCIYDLINPWTQSAFNLNLVHTYGFLWVPATGSTPGSASFYFDGQLMRAPQTWTQYNGSADTPPPTSSTPWTFGVLDQQHMALTLAIGGSPQYMNIYSVRVWQASSAGNLVQ